MSMLHLDTPYGGGHRNRMNETERRNLTENELVAFLGRVRPRLEPADYEILEGLAETVEWLSQELAQKKTSIERLRQMMFGPSTEKTQKALGDTAQASGDDPSRSKEDKVPSHPAEKAKGHGRNGVDDYPGARRIPVAHETLKPGDCCPSCKKAKVYRLTEPGRVITIVGQAPLPATIYEPERLRCSGCQEVFTARLPREAPLRKYDETAGAIVAVLKYGTGVPFYRMEKLQETFGVPLPATTQWEIVLDVAVEITPVYEELVRQAAQGEVVHNDDTTMTILSLGQAEDSAKPEEGKEDPERTGVFTSGIVSRCQDQTIALYFTGPKHAGENLAEILKKRASELTRPIQMCDGLSRNEPEDFETILANCLAHGRRKFVELVANFPEECRYVLEKLRDVYRNEAAAKQQGLSPEERLTFHQAQSGPLMEELKKYLNALLEDKLVEPNSSLGHAITYMLKRWEPLTLFLRQPGAPLDNNICERALKMAILHRKNALFYKTERGAWVGDLFMSLIQTCRLCGANPFEYLTALQKNIRDVRKDPAAWMPWNYHTPLKALDTS